MTDGPRLYQLTIRCYEDCDGLIGELRREAGGHLLSDVRKSLRGSFRTVDVLADDVAAIRMVLKGWAGRATLVQISALGRPIPVEAQPVHQH